MVKIKVDLNRREKLKRLHTATHIMNYSPRKVLGNHVWQNGSNLKPEFGTLDITHYENLTFDEISEIERLANQIIFEDRKVVIEEIDRAEAEKKYGFGIYQGGAIPMKKLRIVTIANRDIEACGGLHMLSTGGIGLIKLVDSQKIQDGVVRVKYVVNEFALESINSTQKLVSDLKELYSVGTDDILKTSTKFFNDWKEQKKEIEKMKSLLKDSYVKLASNSDEINLEGDFDMGFVMELFTSLLKDKTKLKVESQKFIIATKDYEIKGFKKEIPKGKFSIYIK